MIQYVVAEGDKIKPGTPLAIVDNYWARLEIQANGEGIVTKTFFDKYYRKNRGSLCDRQV